MLSFNRKQLLTVYTVFALARMTRNDLLQMYIDFAAKSIFVTWSSLKAKSFLSSFHQRGNPALLVYFQPVGCIYPTSETLQAYDHIHFIIQKTFFVRVFLFFFSSSNVFFLSLWKKCVLIFSLCNVFLTYCYIKHA